MSAAVERAAELELERIRPVPPRVVACVPLPRVPVDAAEVWARIAARQPVTPAEAAEHRRALLEALDGIEAPQLPRIEES